MPYKHLQDRKRMDPRALVDARRVSLRRAAEAFVDGTAYPDAVDRALRSHGVASSSALLVEDSTPHQHGCEGAFAGLLLTVDRRFIAFEVDASDDECPARVDEFRDVTAETNTDERVPGIHTSDGWLAQQLLAELLAEGRLATDSNDADRQEAR